MNILSVSHVSKQEGASYLVKDVSFTQEENQKIAIAGATGSGKTTLLKMIAGLVQPTDGNIFFEELRIKGPNEKLIPGHPSIAYLSQHFELRNHYRVEELLAMANKLTDEEATTIYEVCQVSSFLKRWTNQLSGGEKQRISLALLLVTKPRLLLLDEPFSNLDPIHKNILKQVIEDISDKLNITCILVSHDSLDTLSWAHQILVLKDGQLIQQGTPQEVYAHPTEEYTAALFGKYNVLHPALAKAFAHFSDIEMNLINSFIRPESFKLVSENNGVKGTVLQQRFLGNYYEAAIDVLGYKLTVQNNRPNLSKCDEVYLSLLTA